MNKKTFKKQVRRLGTRRCVKKMKNISGGLELAMPRFHMETQLGQLNLLRQRMYEWHSTNKVSEIGWGPAKSLGGGLIFSSSYEI